MPPALSISPDVVAGTAQVMAAVAQAIDALPVAGTAGVPDVRGPDPDPGRGDHRPGACPGRRPGPPTSAPWKANTPSRMWKAWLATSAIGQLAEPAVAISSVDPGSRSRQALDVPVHGLAHRDAHAEPVSISYTTVDGSATAANGDYTPVSGTLTWAAGDTSPQTISVPVTDVMPASDEYFLVELSNPVNTEVEEANGVGEILSYTEFSTTTTLTASTLSTPGQANVTFTAVVTNHDPSTVPATAR